MREPFSRTLTALSAYFALFRAAKREGKHGEREEEKYSRALESNLRGETGQIFYYQH